MSRVSSLRREVAIVVAVAVCLAISWWYWFGSSEQAPPFDPQVRFQPAGPPSGRLVPIHMVRPSMPPDVKEKGLHGEYTLRITVDDRGTVREAVVEQSTHPIVNEAVIAAAKQCRYRVPPSVRGKSFTMFVAGMY